MSHKFAHRGLWLLIAVGALVAGMSGVSMVFTRVSARDTGVVRYSAPAFQPELQVAPVARAESNQTAIACGTLRPVQSVQVISEVSGKVTRVLKGVNTRVKQGEVIALFVPEMRESERQSASWQVRAARRQLMELPVEQRNQQLKEERLRIVLERKKIAVARAKSALELATIERKRLEFLVGKEIVSRGELDLKNLTEANAKHDLHLMELELADCANDLKQIEIDNVAMGVREELAKADLCDQRSELRIVAPIDGVILDQRVIPGQTVSAAFQTPVLFGIGSDLKDLEIDARVADADIGRIKTGQQVRCEIAGCPGETFNGVVTMVKLQGDSKDNRVTFPVVVRIQNPADAEHPFGRLLPGMTATVRIDAGESNASLAAVR